MQALLAQASSGSLFDVVTKVFSRADTLAHPDELLKAIENMSMIWAAIFLAAGLVCMISGYKHYRWVTVIMALAIGAFVGYVLGQNVKAHYIVSGCMAALFAVCCWPLMKYTVAALGGLVGAFLGANAWTAIGAFMKAKSGSAPNPNAAADLHWVGALMGLIIVGMLAFIVFKVAVVLFTSVSGATLAMIGALALLLQVPSFKGEIMGSMQHNAIALPLLMVVAAAMGLILQHASPEKGGAAAGGSAGASAKPAAKAA